MTSLFDPDTGKRIPCTVLQLDRVEVVGVKTRPRHGYWAVQVGTGWKRPHRETRPMLGHWAAQKVSPKERVVEFRVKDGEGLPSVGMHIGPSWFKVGQFVDARSNSRGMGFAGVMKRWGFGGQPASHGVSLTHRSLGSAGGSQGSGSRVLPGKKMAGRMGNKRITVQSLKVLRTDEEAGLVIVNGCLAGPKGCYVKIQDAVKKPWPDVAPVPYVEPPIKEPTDATADSTV
ncbi:translation protein [Lineolata rhizophorae]|uniref:Large ribosomal subunit protein uL3m n=1 Tax=Lineolata rhizophorae TaxID=578093 RepID=A0A6A6PBF5_9PEZI|nr:translation protein [Lineolata rhizophorae]